MYILFDDVIRAIYYVYLITVRHWIWETISWRRGYVIHNILCLRNVAE